MKTHSTAAWSLVLTLVLIACGSGGNTETPLPPPPATPTTPSDPSFALSDVDLSVSAILEALEGAEPDLSANSDLRLPSSLRDYMSLNGYQPAVVQVGDPAISTVCDVLEENAGQEIVIAVVDAVLTRLKRAPTGDGFGLLVSAAGYGCVGYKAYISSQVQLMDLPRPTAPPLADVPTFKKNEVVEIRVQGQHVTNVVVNEVKCKDSAGFMPAGPGDVFIGVQATIEALADNEEYDAASWRVVVDGATSNGPGLNLETTWSPVLHSGTLQTGGWVQGWMAFDVPRPTDGFSVIYRRGANESGAVFRVSFDPCP